MNNIGWKDYLLFCNWLTDAKVNDTLCIQIGNDEKFVIKLIKHEKEDTLYGIQYY